MREYTPKLTATVIPNPHGLLLLLALHRPKILPAAVVMSKLQILIIGPSPICSIAELMSASEVGFHFKLFPATWSLQLLSLQDGSLLFLYAGIISWNAKATTVK